MNRTAYAVAQQPTTIADNSSPWAVVKGGTVTTSTHERHWPVVALTSSQAKAMNYFLIWAEVPPIGSSLVDFSLRLPISSTL